MSIVIRNPSGVLRNIDQQEKLLRKYAAKKMKAATAYLKSEVKKNVSLTDHSLFDLAQMGHPYGLEGGMKGSFEAAIGKSPRQVLHDPNYLIHKHGNKFRNALFSKVEIHERMGFMGGDIIVGIVGFDESKCEYARYVIMGTRKMISRDVLTETLNDNRDEIERKVKA